MTKICSIDSCKKVVQARGWCCTHYENWLRHGDALRSIRTERWLARVKPCLICGQDFLVRRPNQKYCSHECYQPTLWKVPKKCSECRKTFIPKRPENTTFCSRKCASVKNLGKGTQASVEASEHRRKIWPSNWIKYSNCIFCDQVFAYHYKRSKTYCSDDCREWHLEEQKQQSRRPKQYKLKFCKVCGKETLTWRKDKKFCSNICWEKDYRKRNRSLVLEEKRRFRDRHHIRIIEKSRKYEEMRTNAYRAFSEMGLIPKNKHAYGSAALRMAKRLNLIGDENGN